jgi:hypothetical protein
MEKITTIIIEGHMATGKTRLGSLLTFNGRAGVVIEADELRGSNGRILYTDAWLRRIEFCPRVVITTTSTTAEVMKHPRLQNLLAARASLDHNVELLKLDLVTFPVPTSPFHWSTPTITKVPKQTPTKKKKTKHES